MTFESGFLIIIHHQLTNKNIILSSFKSSRDIQRKEGGPDSCFGQQQVNNLSLT